MIQAKVPDVVKAVHETKDLVLKHVKTPPKTEGANWSNGLFSFYETPVPCALSCLCGSCVYGCLKQNLNGGDDAVCQANCCTIWLSNCICVSCLVAGAARYQVREKKGIKGSVPEDILTACFCSPCALNQEMREVGLNPKVSVTTQ